MDRYPCANRYKHGVDCPGWVNVHGARCEDCVVVSTDSMEHREWLALILPVQSISVTGCLAGQGWGIVKCSWTGRIRSQRYCVEVITMATPLSSNEPLHVLFLVSARIPTQGDDTGYTVGPDLAPAGAMEPRWTTACLEVQSPMACPSYCCRTYATSRVTRQHLRSVIFRVVDVASMRI